MCPFFSDPFADTGEGVGGTPGMQGSLIHIRIQQRNGRKTLTTVQGVDPKYDFKKIVKAAKKVIVATSLSCLYGVYMLLCMSHTAAYIIFHVCLNTFSLSTINVYLILNTLYRFASVCKCFSFLSQFLYYFLVPLNLIK